MSTDNHSTKYNSLKYQIKSWWNCCLEMDLNLTCAFGAFNLKIAGELKIDRDGTLTCDARSTAWSIPGCSVGIGPARPRGPSISAYICVCTVAVWIPEIWTYYFRTQLSLCLWVLCEP